MRMCRHSAPKIWQYVSDGLRENDIVLLNLFVRNGISDLCGGNDMIHLVADGLKHLLDGQAVAVCESQDFQGKTPLWLGGVGTVARAFVA